MNVESTALPPDRSSFVRRTGSATRPFAGRARRVTDPLDECPAPLTAAAPVSASSGNAAFVRFGASASRARRRGWDMSIDVVEEDQAPAASRSERSGDQDDRRWALL
jgi:hypothetical protein